jgi:hypothetical protein
MEMGFFESFFLHVFALIVLGMGGGGAAIAIIYANDEMTSPDGKIGVTLAGCVWAVALVLFAAKAINLL